MWWRNTKLSREAAALAAYRKYLELCISNPGLATYYSFSKAFDGKSFKDIRKSRSEIVDSYEWFLSYLLNTCEEILENVSSKGEWRRALQNQLNYHATALEILWPKWRATYGCRMQRLGDSVIKPDEMKKPTESQ